MAALQTRDEIQSLLARLEGCEIKALQVFGINSLKSLSPSLDVLAGEVIQSTRVNERLFTVTTANHEVVFDLQRTGKMVWLDTAEPWVMSGRALPPTARFILVSGQGFDLTEPAKTKRITVTLSNRPRADR